MLETTRRTVIENLFAVPYDHEFVDMELSDDENRAGMVDFMVDWFQVARIPLVYTFDKYEDPRISNIRVELMFLDGAHHNLHLPREVTSRHRVGGCDGEHPGPCRTCGPRDVVMVWTLQDEREHRADFYAVYYGSEE